ncbi:nitroreductase family protein [bacterium]|nr:nitroreductase family protein [bacterium]
MNIKNLPLVLLIFLLFPVIASAQEVIPLPDPKIRGELMKALNNRATLKKFSTKELSMQTLSEVLWAAFGVNDKRTGRRTAATAFTVREMLLYALTKDGVFLYDAPKQALIKITGEDVRKLVSTQEYAVNVPLHIIYVADYNISKARYPVWGQPSMEEYSTMHTGLIAQNVYLYCAAHGMGAVIRDVGGEKLREKLGLDPNQKIIVSQAVGYPGSSK